MVFHRILCSFVAINTLLLLANVLLIQEPNEPEQVRVFIPEQPQQPTEPLKPPRYSGTSSYFIIRILCSSSNSSSNNNNKSAQSKLGKGRRHCESKSPLVTMARRKFAAKSNPSHQPIPKPHYVPHPWTRPVYNAKRHPDQIRRFSTMHSTGRRTYRPTDRPRESLITTITTRNSSKLTKL